MNFLNFFSIGVLFFFLGLPAYGIPQWAKEKVELAPEPLVSVVSTIPSGYTSRFSSITTAGGGKLLISGDNKLFIFDGLNWNFVALSERLPPVSDSQGRIYYYSKNQIERLAPTGKGTFTRDIIVDSTTLAPCSEISGLQVGESERLFFSGNGALWMYSNGLHLLDSSSNRLFLLGNEMNPYYAKEDEGIFSIIPNSTPLPVPKTQFIATRNLLNVLNINGRTIAISKHYPWLVDLENGKPAAQARINQFLRDKQIRLIKAYLYNNELFLLTQGNGIVILNDNLEVVSYIKSDIHSTLEHAIDMLPLSQGMLMVLTRSTILRIIRTEIAGLYAKSNYGFSAPSSLFYSNNILYSSTGFSLVAAEYDFGHPNKLLFNNVSGINGHISALYKHNETLYAAGKSGVYAISGKSSKLLVNNSELSSAEFFKFSEFDSELWLLYILDDDLHAKCLSNNYIIPFNLPLPQKSLQIDKLLVSNDFVFLNASSGKWYKSKLSEHSGWAELFNDPLAIKSFHIPSNHNESSFISKGGEVYRFNPADAGIGAMVASDSSSYLSPILETDNSLIIKRFFKVFPEVFSIWFYRLKQDDSLYYPHHFAASLPTTEIVNQALLMPDSTLFLSSTSGLFYFSNHKMLRSAFSTIVSIYNVSLEMDNSRVYLKDGYVLPLHKQDYPTKVNANKNFYITLASIGCSEWGLSHSNVQFASYLEGYDKDWTVWTKNNTREISRLTPGDYTLFVKARNFIGEESSVESISFVVLPRFYQTQLFFVAFALLGFVGLFMVYRWRGYLHAKERYKLESLINMRTEELVKEKEKTENLLARVLPKDTADELKEKGRVNTQRFQVVTVLFCDIEGFTRITDETNPEALIDQLDKFFLYFDSVVERFRIEKIKTIGDAYMCAGGIPKKNRTNPVEVVLAALEMMQYLKHITSSLTSKTSVWDLRIGIDTGPVIAGVVGRNKLSYDIWGSTVNTASRMESSGEVGQINISGNTYMLVKDYFICTFRGKMPVKNKGDIQMYFVNGIKPSLSEGMKGVVPNQDFYIQLQLIRLGDLEDFILEKLEKGLPKNLYYHNLKHTVDVYTQVELIGRSENVTKEELLLLRTAALFHDAGHLIDYDTHEEMAVKLAREILPQYQYTEKQIDIIAELIMVTKLPPKPKNLMEEIMCDADLDYLGRPDFIPVSNTLYKELHEHGKIGAERDWNELQVKFIDSHFYFTKTARRLRNVNKQSQLDKLKAWMEKN